VHLAYRNDDGGPGYGKDSRCALRLQRMRVHREAADVRGLTGEEYAYRLTIHPCSRLPVDGHAEESERAAGVRIPLTVTGCGWMISMADRGIARESARRRARDEGSHRAGQISTVALVAPTPMPSLPARRREVSGQAQMAVTRLRTLRTRTIAQADSRVAPRPMCS